MQPSSSCGTSKEDSGRCIFPFVSGPSMQVIILMSPFLSLFFHHSMPFSRSFILLFVVRRILLSSFTDDWQGEEYIPDIPADFFEYREYAYLIDLHSNLFIFHRRLTLLQEYSAAHCCDSSNGECPAR